MRPSRATRRLPLLAAAIGLAALAHTAVAAAAPGEPTPPRRERVASVEVDLDGEGGVLVTEAEFLGGANGRYRFGTACGKAIAEPVLARLLHSLSDQRPISVIAEDKAAGACVTRLVFFAQ